MNEQEQFWAGEFGEEYLARNRVNWLERVPFWTDIIAKIAAGSALEVGCNAGWNLLALRTVRPDLYLRGVDINSKAIEQAKHLGLYVTKREANQSLGVGYSLVFTAGVLIHIGPEALNEAMERIKSASSRYVLAIEYESDEEEEVNYRGHTERLWKRPYGKLYEDMGLKLIESGPAQGFDRCTYWLLEKRT